MMPQREASEAGQSSSYGGYGGEQIDNQQQFESSYQRQSMGGAAGKLYPSAPDNHNVLRLIAFGMSLLTLIVMAVICLIIVGGSGGWISFCAASLAIFIIAVVAIDKIK
ncbi:hypothetical protein KDA_71180 [Dictyobacter alpinus]|uniref:Uncharacterized protein n=1 Tax=Dictyobacter alpinus TaxID=2014873 RepID=A0A402BJW9_9CHLR|nr:hypothetical protein [Dictyobacter alpinus]GCE31634.1 hypothetical protein KDA_71180 [Dictyobacter alpinus]